MQNFRLLTEVGNIDKPVILKRGLCATIKEFLMSAEYIVAQGNDRVILCERGIRTFETETRNTLDISAVPLLKQLTHLPVIVDPSHAVGRVDLVPAVSRAAVAAGADGKLYFLSPAGEPRGDVQASQTPIIALALSGDGKLVAAAGIRGAVALVDRATRKVQHVLVGPGLPVWSVAFLPDSRTLLTGGTDRVIRRLNASTGEPADTLLVGAPDDPLAAYAGDPGARVFRACVACHTLKADEVSKAGPSLWHIFGRKVGSLPGYRYSDALTNLSIVWTPETVSKMFEVGPMTYTPGTKMPEQTIGSAEDRQALVEFLEKVTQ